MDEAKQKLSGPDFTKGVDLSKIEEGAILLGHAHGEQVVLVRHGETLSVIGAICTHYGGPLSDGLVVGDTLRCPWHHACFSLRTGEALRAPALDPVSCWRVEQRDGKAYVTGKVQTPKMKSTAKPDQAKSIVIVGGGGAGNGAAEMLRREGFSESITMLSADKSLPCDRPNLSKGYLSGVAQADTNPLRSRKYYRDHEIDLKLDARVAKIDAKSGHVELVDGTRFAYDQLLLATGAEPVRLGVPGADLPHVHYLRTLVDGRSLVAKAAKSSQAVVIGASFIGLEVAASLRARNVEVHVVAPDAIPMEKILGAEVGTHIRKLHQHHGVHFHLGAKVTEIDKQGVTLNSGKKLPADLVVVGIGVKPATELAEKAGLAIDRGVVVDEFLETSVPGIYAAGDIARWPDRRSGERIRVEHWVVAERQGQTAARNMLGRRERFDMVPFFWTEQYDFALSYVGHAERWDTAEIDGKLGAEDCTITYRSGGEKMAFATIHRDLESLQVEVDLERLARTEAHEQMT